MSRHHVYANFMGFIANFFTNRLKDWVWIMNLFVEGGAMFQSLNNLIAVWEDNFFDVFTDNNFFFKFFWKSIKKWDEIWYFLHDFYILASFYSTKLMILKFWIKICFPFYFHWCFKFNKTVSTIFLPKDLFNVNFSKGIFLSASTRLSFTFHSS